MALTWNVKNVKYYQDNLDELYVKVESFGQEYDDVNAETKGMIFSTMFLGIGHITEDNASEFYGRFKVLEKIDDIYLTNVYENGEWVNKYVTPAIVHKHIGLVTNVIWESTTRWASRIAKNPGRANPNHKYSAQEIKSIIGFYALEYKESVINL